MPLTGQLRTIALRLSRNAADADDLVQETLTRALVAWPRFTPGSNLRAWLARILTNAFINRYRKRRRHQRVTTERAGDARMATYGTCDDRTEDLGDALCATLLCDEVVAAMSRLGADAREVVERADLHGEQYQVIADALQLPIGTVMSRLFRARRQLEGDLRVVAWRDWGLLRAAPGAGHNVGSAEPA